MPPPSDAAARHRSTSLRHPGPAHAHSGETSRPWAATREAVRTERAWRLAHGGQTELEARVGAHAECECDDDSLLVPRQLRGDKAHNPQLGSRATALCGWLVKRMEEDLRLELRVRLDPGAHAAAKVLRRVRPAVHPRVDARLSLGHARAEGIEV
eukprot:7135429-Prymnesium_polylepis.2